MSLYTKEEICIDCIYAYKCEKCNSFEHCTLYLTPNFLNGECDGKKTIEEIYARNN
jgi:hypothetical protein